MLDSITLYVGSYLSEIGDTFGRLVACINSADKAIKDFDFAGVRFLIQFVDKNTVNKFMDPSYISTMPESSSPVPLYRLSLPVFNALLPVTSRAAPSVICE